MELKLYLRVSLVCYILNYIAMEFLSGMWSSVTVLADGYGTTLQFSTFAGYNILGLFSMFFFLLFLVRSRSCVRYKAIPLVVIVLCGIVLAFNVFESIVYIGINSQYGGQYVVDEYIFTSGVCSLLMNDAYQTTIAVVYRIIEPVAYAFLVVQFFCMKNLVPLTRTVGVIAFLSIVVNNVLLLSCGYSYYEFFQIGNSVFSIFYVATLILLSMNAYMLEKKYLDAV